MKFMMNGALTIGTLDGANVEMREEVGADNFFLFGLSAEQVGQLQRAGYRSAEFAERDAELRDSLGLIGSGHFSRGDREMFRSRDRRVLQAHRVSRPGSGGARALSLRCAAFALSSPCGCWRC
jgi:starch phosphorylase